ncbi:NUDIX hydrolase [Actinoplanes sp. CA-015351]|uniref:NUDIX hydrolase n=1 Tax=Actinoplanes sp. CA-015351 TaxID=3239897 RepID=UPI003D95C349
MTDSSADVPLTKVFGERTIYDNPWVRLVQVDIEPPDGRRFWHHVVRLQTVAAAVVVDEQNRVLMLRRHRWATQEIGWELPGGIVGQGESGADAAMREVEEETGWKPLGSPQLVARFQPMPGMVDTPHEVYFAKGAELVGEPTDLEEAGIVDWVPLDSVTSLIKNGEVLGSGSLVGLLGVLSSGLLEQ